MSALAGVARTGLRVGAGAALWGILLFGLPLSLLHLGHNDFGSPFGSLLVALHFAFIYGSFGAALAIPTLFVWRLVRALQRRFLPELPLLPGDDPQSSEMPRRSERVLALLPSLWVLGTSYVLYGLTYEQTVLLHPQSGVAMAIYLALAGALVTAVLLGLMALLLALQRRFRERGTLRTAVLASLLVLLAAHPLVAWLQPDEPGGEAPAGVALSELEVRRPLSKVALLGFDGLDPDLVDELVAAGEMPNLERLRSEGVWGRLATQSRSNSAIIWASVYTGTMPREHRILDFFRVTLPGVAGGLFPVHRTWFQELAARLPWSERVPIDRRDVERLPLWEIADFFGRSIGVADGYFYSYPAFEPTTPSGWFLSYGIDTVVNALDEGRMEATRLPEFIQPVDLLAPERLPREPDFDWQRRVLLELLAERPQPDLVNLYCHEPDYLLHDDFRFYRPHYYLFVDESQRAAGAERIVEFHRELDRFLGRLVETLEPGTSLLLVSDHGHAPTLVHHMDTQHRHGPDGVVLLWGGAFAAGARLEDASIYDVAPTVLHLLGLPVPRDLPGRVWSDTLSPDLRAAPVRDLPTYEGLWRPRIRDVERGEALDELEIEKLRKMGYVS